VTYANHSLVLNTFLTRLIPTQKQSLPSSQHQPIAYVPNTCPTLLMAIHISLCCAQTTKSNLVQQTQLDSCCRRTWEVPLRLTNKSTTHSPPTSTQMSVLHLFQLPSASVGIGICCIYSFFCSALALVVWALRSLMPSILCTSSLVANTSMLLSRPTSASHAA